MFFGEPAGVVGFGDLDLIITPEPVRLGDCRAPSKVNDDIATAATASPLKLCSLALGPGYTGLGEACMEGLVTRTRWPDGTKLSCLALGADSRPQTTIRPASAGLERSLGVIDMAGQPKPAL